jgi:transcription initiation factor TFIID subunit 1
MKVVEAERNGQLKISNAEQNRIYEEEKRKVWDLQAQALSNPVPPTLEAEDEDRSAPTPAGWGPRIGRSESRRAFSRGHSLAATPFADSPREMSPSQYSADGESNFTGNPYGGKVLRIKRIVSG